jgi:indole-3-glycerol phosphate synthase/phosphoribosylanthranilate isomerase
MIGFVLAESPRKASAAVIRECTDLPVLKAAVVVLGAGEALPEDIQALLREGALDFVQFHGDETPETVRAWPSYKAVNLRAPGDAAAMDSAGSPAVLVDAFSPEARGGTGKRLDPELMRAASEQRRLWIAGGLNDENVGAIVKEWMPGLVDVSSGVEAKKGRKDHGKVRRFVAEAKGNIPSAHRRSFEVPEVSPGAGGEF